MPNQQAPEENKASRAEINRQTAKKSTGQKTGAAKVTSNLNGVKNGTRTVFINLSGCPGVSILSSEGASKCQAMIAEYTRAVAPPNGRAEVSIVWRMVDADLLMPFQHGGGSPPDQSGPHASEPSPGCLACSTPEARFESPLLFLRRFDHEPSARIS